MSKTEKKNGKAAAAADAPKKEKKPFTALLNMRLDRIEKVTKNAGKQLARTGKDTAPLKNILASIITARESIKDLPADFKPQRAASTAQPMAKDTEIEIVPDRHVRWEGVWKDSVIKGKFKVLAATPTVVHAVSLVDGTIQSAFSRRDVQLPGTVRVKREKKNTGAVAPQAQA